VRVELFLQYECLLKNTLAGHGPPLPPLPIRTCSARKNNKMSANLFNTKK